MDTSDRQEQPKVVVIGGGFGGLEMTKALRKKPVRVTLIDRNNYHTFQPLLYQVATAGLDPNDIAKALRDVLQKRPNAGFRLGTVVDVDKDRKQVTMADGQAVPYDYLVVAAGAVTNYFGIEGVETYALPMKNVQDAIELRGHVLYLFEQAEQDPALMDEGILNFVVVGGGPTGVETAGALIELFRLVLKKDFRGIDISKARVILVEMLPHLLSSYDESLRRYTARALEEMGVEVRLETSVVRATATAVEFDDGEVIPTQTLIWGAGIQANPLAKTLDTELTRGGRVVVEPNLSLPGHPDHFVIGDMAASKDEEGNLHPQVVQLATQGAQHVAEQILHRINGEPGGEAFVYKDLGQMATIGRNAGVVQLPGGLKLKGFVAWFGWLFLHLIKLVGFRNRISVFWNWMWNYFTYDQSARLILDLPERDKSTPRVTVKSHEAPVSQPMESAS